jgi:hypothetical protein
MAVEQVKRIARIAVARHLLKPISSQLKHVVVGPALEAVLGAAAERPPSNEASPTQLAGSSLGGLRRSFVTVLADKCIERLLALWISIGSRRRKVYGDFQFCVAAPNHHKGHKGHQGEDI